MQVGELHKLLNYVVSLPTGHFLTHSSLRSANRPQSAQQITPQIHQSQQSGNVPFIPSNPTQNFDQFPYFNLDINTAAKQMAAISAAGVQRQMANVNGRPTTASALQNPQAVGGTTSGSFLGGIPSAYNQPAGFPGPSHDTTSSMQFNPAALSGQPSAQGNYPPQPHANTPSNPSLNASMSQPNLAPQEVMKQRQRNFLMGLANVHATRGAPLPPALTGVPYPPNYDPTHSPWKSLDCTPGQYGVVRVGGKEIDLLRLWGIVCQVGGWSKVRRFMVYYCRMLKHGITGLTTAGLDTNRSPL